MPLRAFGIDLTEATLSEYALSQGITESIDSMTQAEKVMLRYQYILSATSNIQGDFSRTSGTWANQVRLLTLNFQQFGSVVGQGLISALLPAIQALNKFMTKLYSAAKVFKNFMYVLTGYQEQSTARGVIDETSESLYDTEDAGDSAASGLDNASDAAENLKKTLSVLNFDELNQLQKKTTTSTSGTGDTGIGTDGLLDSLDEAYDAVDDLINSNAEERMSDWAKRIRTAILSGNWYAAGNAAAQMLKSGLRKVKEAISWDNIGPTVTEFTNAFTGFVNGFMAETGTFVEIGQTIGEGATTLIRGFNQILEGIDFEQIGSDLSEAFRGMIITIPWGEFGNLLGTKFMISWEILNGFVEDMAKKNDLGLTGWQELGDAMANLVEGIFNKVDGGVIANALTGLINGAFKTLDQFIKTMDSNGTWGNIAEDIKSFLTGMIDGIEWESNGTTFRNLISRLVKTIDESFDDSTFVSLGASIGKFLRGMIESDIDWEELGNVIGKAFMIPWNALGGLVQELSKKNDAGISGWQELGEKLAEMTMGLFDEVNMPDLADILVDLINGAIDLVSAWTATLETNGGFAKIKEDFKTALDKVINDINWDGAADTFSTLLGNLCDAIGEARNEGKFKELGEKIGTFIAEIPWLDVLTTAAGVILDTLTGALSGVWDSDDTSFVEKALSSGFLLITVGNITGLSTLCGNIIKFIAEKLAEKAAINSITKALSGTLSSAATEASGGIGTMFGELLSSTASVVGVATAIVGVGSAAIYGTEKVAEFVEKIQGGNGTLTEFGGATDSFLNILTSKGYIASDTAGNFEELKESLEHTDMSSDEFKDAYSQLLTVLASSGVTKDQMLECYQSLRQEYQLTDDQAGYLEEAIGSLDTAINTTSTVTIPNSATTFGQLEDAVKNLGNQFSLAPSQITALDTVLMKHEGADETQEAYDEIIGLLEDMGVNTTEAAKIISEQIPSASTVVQTSAAEIKTSVDSVGTSAETASAKTTTSFGAIVTATQNGASAVLSSINTNISGSSGAEETYVASMNNMAKSTDTSMSAAQKSAETATGGIFSTIASKISGASGAEKEYTSSMEDISKSTDTNMGDAQTFAGTALDGIDQKTYDIMKHVIALVRTAWGTVSSNTETTWEDVSDKIGDETDAFSRKVDTACSGILGSFSSLARDIPKKFNNLADNIYSSAGGYYAFYNIGFYMASAVKSGLKAISMPRLKYYISDYTEHTVNGSTTYTPVYSPWWYAKGGLFTSAQVIGVGESGNEAVLPLENSKTMQMIADSITGNMSNDGLGLTVEEIQDAVSAGVAIAMMNNSGNSNITVYAELKTEDNEVLARAVTKGQKSLGRRMNPTAQSAY